GGRRGRARQLVRSRTCRRVAIDCRSALGAHSRANPVSSRRGLIDASPLELWPAPVEPDTVLRVGSGNAEHWHREVGSTSLVPALNATLPNRTRCVASTRPWDITHLESYHDRVEEAVRPLSAAHSPVT